MSKFQSSSGVKRKHKIYRKTEKEYLTCLKKDKYANLHIELKQRI
jgi:hypothetical protein